MKLKREVIYYLVIIFLSVLKFAESYSYLNNFPVNKYTSSKKILENIVIVKEDREHTHSYIYETSSSYNVCKELTKQFSTFHNSFILA